MPIPSRSVLILFLTLLPTASAQLPVHEVVARAAGIQAATGELRAIDEIYGGEDSGWVSVARRVVSPGVFESVFFGAFSSSDLLGPRVLREPATIAGVQQLSIFEPSLAAGRIAYLCREPGGFFLQSAWLDDDRIAYPGGPAGLSGRTWEHVNHVQAATNGSAVVLGRTGAQADHWLAVEEPSGAVLVETGNPVAGFGETVGQIRSIDRSPDGSSWVAVVQLAPSNRLALLVDGAPYLAAGGQPVVQGGIGSGALLQPDPSAVWLGLGNPCINDAGEVAFGGAVDTAAGIQALTIRNGRQAFDEIADVFGFAGAVVLDQVSEQGHAIWRGTAVRFPVQAIDRQPVFGAEFAVDEDGDGQPDLGWSIRPRASTDAHTALAGNGELYGLASLEPVGSPNTRLDAVFQVRLVQGGSVVCSGEPNSTGFHARLQSQGIDDPAFNTMDLYAIGLPQGALALPLLSLSQGPGVTPPGSQGTLCLGGAIGRGVFATIAAEANGTGRSRVLLNVLPQPNGTVPAQSGQTWYAQLWYRDTVAGGPTSNFSDAIQISFR